MVLQRFPPVNMVLCISKGDEVPSLFVNAMTKFFLCNLYFAHHTQVALACLELKPLMCLSLYLIESFIMWNPTQRYQQAPGGSSASSSGPPPSRGAPPPYPGAPSGLKSYEL